MKIIKKRKETNEYCYLFSPFDYCFMTGENKEQKKAEWQMYRGQNLMKLGNW